MQDQEEPEEVVISSWQKPDLPKDVVTNGNLSETIRNGPSKKNADVKAWLSEPEDQHIKSEDLNEELTIDEDMMTEFIGEDRENDKENNSLVKPRRPKPKHRNIEGVSIPENKIPFGKNERADDFNSQKSSAAHDLFSSTKSHDSDEHILFGLESSPGPVEKLFSRSKHEENPTDVDKDAVTSLRPVPSPRDKPKFPEHDKKSSTHNDTLSSDQMTADKLFDSIGKSNKSVSFTGIEDDSKNTTDTNRDFSNKKIRPEILPRTHRNKHSNSQSPRAKSLERDSLKEHHDPRQSKHDDEDNIQYSEGKVLESEDRNRKDLRQTYEKPGTRKIHSKKGEVSSDTFEEHAPSKNDDVIPSGRRFTGNESNVRSPMKARKAVEEMTKSPDTYEIQYESRDSPQRDPFSTSKRISSSMTDLRGLGTTHFQDSADSVRSKFTSSRGIMEAVYSQWLQEKQKKMKEAVRKKAEEKRKEDERIKEKEAKEALLAKKAFEAWSSKKVEVIKTDVKKKKELKNKELDTRREKVLKKQDAKKYFESWKNKKDESLKESFRKKKSKEREEKQRKIDDHKEKTVIAKKAYDIWKSQKDEQLKEEARRSRQSEKLKAKYEREAEMEKRQACEKTFQDFLGKKGTGRRPPPSPTLTQRAWCPGGLTRGTNLIPEKVQPVITPPQLDRSRSFSGRMNQTMKSFNSTGRLARGW